MREKGEVQEWSLVVHRNLMLQPPQKSFLKKISENLF